MENKTNRPIGRVIEILGFSGIGFIGYGVSLIYRPAAYIVVGLLFLAICILASRIK